MDKNAVLEKIKKCLALSKSSNEHEAAAALRQAQLLMKKYDVEHADILVSDVSESDCLSSAKIKPSQWELNLAHVICRAFSCDVIFHQGIGRWLFIGCDIKPEIATYTFTVLLRQAKFARAEYIKSGLKRLKKVANKTRRADLFCEGWVSSVSMQVSHFAMTDHEKAAVDAYKGRKFETTSGSARDRNRGKAITDSSIKDYMEGHKEGKNAKIHHGVSGHQQLMIGG